MKSRLSQPVQLSKHMYTRVKRRRFDAADTLVVYSCVGKIVNIVAVFTVAVLSMGHCCQLAVKLMSVC